MKKKIEKIAGKKHKSKDKASSENTRLLNENTAISQGKNSFFQEPKQSNTNNATASPVQLDPESPNFYQDLYDPYFDQIKADIAVAQRDPSYKQETPLQYKLRMLEQDKEFERQNSPEARATAKLEADRNALLEKKHQRDMQFLEGLKKQREREKNQTSDPTPEKEADVQEEESNTKSKCCCF